MVEALMLLTPIESIGKPYHDKSVVEIYNNGVLNDPDYPRPTEEELVSLRKVSDKLPALAFVLCAVEFAERGMSQYHTLLPIICLKNRGVSGASYQGNLSYLPCVEH
jgi:hypothetical protein